MSMFRRIAGGAVVVVGSWAALSAQQAVAPATPPVLETVDQYQGAAAEQFLAKAKVKTVKDIGIGVTLPQKVTLELDGVTRFAAFKTIDEKRQGITQLGNAPPDINFQDSWQTEIPGYVVDTIIGLGMVPATVERRINNKVGSLQWWVVSMMPEAERAKQKLQPPDKEAWDRVVLKMRLFDALIFNVDRHANNILVTHDFQLRLIDHSRSFRPQRQLRDPQLLTRFSKSLLEGLGRLELQDLRKRLNRYLSAAQINGLLQRRDAILELARTRVAELGEAAVIYP
ncbi:MAG: hypothetical protein IPL75_17090 [Acidobacteria bacterium]|jgi:hypothetical protein|nr:hypothetical protein [Acidobacteriota bacterium]